MDNKLRQVTDSIHGTIYLSNLESNLISTPYFYRLHDIYQSSTVYMTYPSNRTKRYEHSLGTMELAGNLLFSAVSNSDISTRGALFKKLNEYFEKVFKCVVLELHSQSAPYIRKNDDVINRLFGNGNTDLSIRIRDFIKNGVREAFRKDLFHDAALDHYQIVPAMYKQDREHESVKHMFLYRCLLQATRIVALFHDVGHPPYSHIIEDVLNALYKEINNNPEKFNKTRASEYKHVMELYQTNDTQKAYQSQTLLSQSSLINAATHERIGLSLLQNAINDVVPTIIKDVANNGEIENSIKAAIVMYYILVVEFSIAILVEKDSFFTSIHKIVDGFVDADRLDYVVRDTTNSGVDWGKVPYKRIIDSAKLYRLDSPPEGAVDQDKQKNISADELNNTFVIAFPKKLAADISDLLLVRYKIFARINYHHRSIKTSAALKACVHDLAYDYLQKHEKSYKCINSDISLLWNSLTSGAGAMDERIIQWNDSWLITVLHKSLINLSDTTDPSKIELKENLEEILLNKKKYYSLLKRGEDSRRFVQNVLIAMGITNEALSKLEEREKKKYINSKSELEESHIEQEIVTDGGSSADNMGNPAQTLFSPKEDAFESLQWIDSIKRLYSNGDIALLQTLLPPLDESIPTIIEKALSDCKARGAIKDYQVYENKGREKLGLPKHDKLLNNIYLYESGETQPFVYDEDYTLSKQLQTILYTVPYVNAYYIPGANATGNQDMSQQLENEIIRCVADKCNYRVKELFGDFFKSEVK